MIAEHERGALNTREHRSPSIIFSRRILLLLLLLASWSFGSRTFAALAKPGDVFPDLAAFGLDGKLPELKGKIVLVDFFASWCPPCHESFPAMEQLHRSYAEKGLVILAISVDTKKADLERFLKKHLVSFPIVRDGTGKLAGTLKIPAMPTSFLIGRDGKIRSVHEGFHGEKTRNQYISEIEDLLK
ncbi:MAG: TlpA disulfide reductase family protein [Limisphaerales bacterium]